MYSVWRTGQFVKMDFTGHFRPESPTSGGQTTNSIPSGGGKLKFKSVVGNQVVEYAALIDERVTSVVGGYLSQTPTTAATFGSLATDLGIEVKVVRKNMSVHDYLIEHGDFDWGHLLSGWKWLLPPKFTLWLIIRYGDLFLILPDGSVNMLDVGIGSLTRMAESRDEFSRLIDEDDNANDWLMIPLVDRLVGRESIKAG